MDLNAEMEKAYKIALAKLAPEKLAHKICVKNAQNLTKILQKFAKMLKIAHKKSITIKTREKIKVFRKIAHDQTGNVLQPIFSYVFQDFNQPVYHSLYLSRNSMSPNKPAHRTCIHQITNLLSLYVIIYTRKTAALRAAFSISCGGLQPSAALLGPFGPSQKC